MKIHNIMRDEWWSAVSAADGSITPYQNQPHTRPVPKKEVQVQVERRDIKMVPFEKRPTNVRIRQEEETRSFGRTQLPKHF